MATGTPAKDRASRAELISMWVAPAVRSRGVATALITAIARWAASTGAATLALSVMPDNVAARRTYGYITTSNTHHLTEVTSAGGRMFLSRTPSLRPAPRGTPRDRQLGTLGQTPTTPPRRHAGNPFGLVALSSARRTAVQPKSHKGDVSGHSVCEVGEWLGALVPYRRGTPCASCDDGMAPKAYKRFGMPGCNS